MPSSPTRALCAGLVAVACSPAGEVTTGLTAPGTSVPMTSSADVSSRDIVNKTFSAPLKSEALGPVGPSFDIARVDETRFVTATQTAQGNLRVIAWKFVEIPQDIFGLLQLGEALGEVTTEIAAVDVDDENLFGVAIRPMDGTMTFTVWQTHPVTGAVTLERKLARAVPASQLIAVPFYKRTVAVLSRTATGKLHVTTLEPAIDNDNNKIVIGLTNDQAETTELTDLYAAAQLGATLVSVVRTGGIPKLILWRFSNSNLISILYGGPRPSRSG